MATITPISTAKGTSYRVQVRKKKAGVIVYSQTETFADRRAAVRWGEDRDAELAKPGALEAVAIASVTTKDMIDKYLAEFCDTAGRTKKAALKQLSEFGFAKKPFVDLKSSDFVAHAVERNETVAPATVLNDFVWLREVIKTAYPAWGIDVNTKEIEAAMILCRKQGLISRSSERERRPTEKELELLDEYFSYRDRRSDIPMRDIMWFAIHSSRRQEEITKLKRADNDPKHKTGWVRGIKHPKKKAYDKKFKYHDKAWEIAERQPKKGARIFPYKPRSIGSAFSRATRVLGIENLIFHDLRHEATSRLFEEGYKIQEVTMFTLHESWTNLKRYANLKPEDLSSLPGKASHPQPSARRDKSPERLRKSTNVPSD